MKQAFLLFSSCAIFGLASCAPHYIGPNAQYGASHGAALGAITGAVIGHQSDHAVEGALLGGLLGGTVGYAAGTEQDSRYGSPQPAPRSTYTPRVSTQLGYSSYGGSYYGGNIGYGHRFGRSYRRRGYSCY